MAQNKRAEHFNSALLVVVISIAVASVAFLTEDKNTTGFVVSEEQSLVIEKPNLMIFDNVDSLKTLSAGDYYIDGNGIVYWIEDESMPAIAKVSSVSEVQKNRKIHIDNEGRVGYLLE